MKKSLIIALLFVVFTTQAQEETITTGTQNSFFGVITTAINNMSGSGTILVKGSIDITDNFTIPDGIELFFYKNGQFNITSGKTVTINGTLKSERNQIFNGGTVVGNAKITRTYPEWFGAKVDDTTDDTAAVQSAINLSKSLVDFATGEYVFDSLVTLENKELALNGATLNFKFTDQGECLIVKDNSIVKNGTIEYSGNNTSGAGNFQCPVIIGNYGSGEGFSNIVLEFLTIKTNSSEGNGIMITGDSNQISIRNIDFPDSEDLGRAILAHWGGADSINTSNKETTHPHNITIDNIKIGNMSLGLLVEDAAGIFLSGAYNVKVSNVQAKELEWKNGLLVVYAGDHGNDYTKNTNAKGFINQDIIFENCHVELAHERVFKVDGQQDQPPKDSGISCDNNGKKFFSGPTLVNITGKAASSNNEHAGVVEESFGTIIKGAKFEGFGYGVITGQNVFDLLIDGGEYFNSGYQGISISSGCYPPERTEVRNALVYHNGKNSGSQPGIFLGNSVDTQLINNTIGRENDTQTWGVQVKVDSENAVLNGNNIQYASSSGIFIDDAIGCQILNNTIGAKQNETQVWGVRLNNGSKRNILENNYVNSASASAFSVGSSTTYDIIYRFKGNGSADNPSVPGYKFQTGVSPITIDTRMVENTKLLVRDLMGREVPTSGIWNKGDRIYNNLIVTNTNGWLCVKSGDAADSNPANRPAWVAF